MPKKKKATPKAPKVFRPGWPFKWGEGFTNVVSFLVSRALIARVEDFFAFLKRFSVQRYEGQGEPDPRCRLRGVLGTPLPPLPSPWGGFRSSYRTLAISPPPAPRCGPCVALRGATALHHTSSPKQRKLKNCDGGQMGLGGE